MNDAVSDFWSRVRLVQWLARTATERSDPFPPADVVEDLRVAAASALSVGRRILAAGSGSGDIAQAVLFLSDVLGRFAGQLRPGMADEILAAAFPGAALSPQDVPDSFFYGLSECERGDVIDLDSHSGRLPEGD